MVRRGKKWLSAALTKLGEYPLEPFATASVVPPRLMPPFRVWHTVDGLWHRSGRGRGWGTTSRRETVCGRVVLDSVELPEGNDVVVTCLACIADR